MHAGGGCVRGGENFTRLTWDNQSGGKAGWVGGWVGDLT